MLRRELWEFVQQPMCNRLFHEDLRPGVCTLTAKPALLPERPERLVDLGSAYTAGREGRKTERCRYEMQAPVKGCSCAHQAERTGGEHMSNRREEHRAAEAESPVRSNTQAFRLPEVRLSI